MKINRLEVFLECALLYSCRHVAAVLLVGDTFDAMIQKHVMMQHLTLLSCIMSCDGP